MKLFKSLPIFLFTAILASCGTQNQTSVLSNRHDTPPNHVSTADVQSLLTHVKDISTSDSQTGTLTISEFVRIMPMKDDQRQIIIAAFPGTFAVSCQNGLCATTGTGRATQAQMDVAIPGLPANPALAITSSVSAQFVMRGDDALEFCNIEGMAAKKLFIKLKIQGLYVALQGNTPYLNVNIGDDRDNYTCR